MESGGTNTGTSQQASQGAQPQTSSGASYGSSSNWGLQQRRLLKPEEVMALPERTAITLQPGIRPIMSNLTRWFEEKNLGRDGSWLSRLAAACATLAMAMIVAAAMTDEFNASHQQPLNAPADTQFTSPMQRQW